MDDNADGVSSIWRHVALVLISANLTGFFGYVLFGWDSVKHSEIDYIMANRAPYIHDKPRIEQMMNEKDRRINDLEERVRELENKR